MDLTQIIVTFLVTLPATLAAIGAFIASLRSKKTIEEKIDQKSDHLDKKLDANTKLTEENRFTAVVAANNLSRQNLETKQTLSTIASAVNGNLDARFEKINEALAEIMRKLDMKADKPKGDS